MALNYNNPYSLDFDGVDEYVSVGDIAILDTTFSEFSVSTWVNRLETGALGYIVGKMGTAGNRGWQLYFGTDDLIYVDYLSGRGVPVAYRRTWACGAHQLRSDCWVNVRKETLFINVKKLRRVRGSWRSKGARATCHRNAP